MYMEPEAVLAVLGPRRAASFGSEKAAWAAVEHQDDRDKLVAKVKETIDHETGDMSDSNDAELQESDAMSGDELDLVEDLDSLTVTLQDPDLTTKLASLISYMVEHNVTCSYFPELPGMILKNYQKVSCMPPGPARQRGEDILYEHMTSLLQPNKVYRPPTSAEHDAMEKLLGETPGGGLMGEQQQREEQQQQAAHIPGDSDSDDGPGDGGGWD